MEEGVTPVLEEFLQGNNQPPWVRAMDNESLQQHANYLLSDVGLVVLRVIGAEQAQNGKAEEVGVAVRVAKLICHCTQ